MLIAKMEWGKDQGLVEVYVLQDDMTLANPISTLRTNVDQSAFDNFILRGSIRVDEIRIGPSLESVLLGTVPMSQD